MAPTLPPLVSLAEFATAIGGIDVDDEARASSVLARVSARARHLAGLTWVDSTTGVLSGVPDAVWSVCLDVATRAYTITAGAYSETVGPNSVMWDRATNSGVVFTPEEAATVRQYRVRPYPGISSIQTTGLPAGSSTLADTIPVMYSTGHYGSGLPTSGGMWE